MKHLRFLAVYAMAASYFLTSALAAEGIEGTWTWVQRSPNGSQSEPKLTLKREGDTLTGKIKTGDRESDIEEGKITADGEVSFVVKRIRNDWKYISKYTGKFDGQKITGRSESDFNGNEIKGDWVAERFKEPTGPGGNWKWIFTRADGTSYDYNARFREEDGIVTGTISTANGTRMEIEEGKFANDLFTFKVVRERDGRKLTAIYAGKVEGDNIVGEMQADWSGEMKSYPWTTARVKRN